MDFANRLQQTQQIELKKQYNHIVYDKGIVNDS